MCIRDSNCTYSIHVVFAHLLQIRGKGPLTATAAFKFESFYGELRRSFVPGTPSPLKQMLKSIYLRRSLTSHSCINTIYYSPKDTQLECNSLIYTYVNEEHEGYKIIGIPEHSNMLQCHPIGLFPITYPELPALEWNKVCLLYTSPSPRD